MRFAFAFALAFAFAATSAAQTIRPTPPSSGLPLTGGTLTGALVGTDATFTGNVANGDAATDTQANIGSETQTFAPAADLGTANQAKKIVLTVPADTTGTNTHDGLLISPTIGNATAGTNAVNGIEIAAVAGDAQVTTTAVKVGAMTGTAAVEDALTVGAGWDHSLNLASPTNWSVSGNTAGSTTQNIWASNVTASGGVDVSWRLNVTPTGSTDVDAIIGAWQFNHGGALFAGAAEVRDVTGYLNTLSGSGAPTGTDCDAAAENGRIYIRTGASAAIYGCDGTAGAWKTIAILGGEEAAALARSMAARESIRQFWVNQGIIQAQAKATAACVFAGGLMIALMIMRRSIRRQRRDLDQLREIVSMSMRAAP